MDLFWIVLFHMRPLLCSRQTEPQGQRPLVSIHVWKHFYNSAFHSFKMESWGHIHCCLWIKWTKGTLKPSFNLASTTDGATFRFQVLKDSLIAWELVWLYVPNFYVSGKILAQDRAKSYRRGGGGKMEQRVEICIEETSAEQESVFWGFFFSFSNTWAAVTESSLHSLGQGELHIGKAECFAGSIWEQDTDAPIAPFVWVLVVLLGQRMAVFPQTPINPRGKV